MGDFINIDDIKQEMYGAAGEIFAELDVQAFYLYEKARQAANSSAVRKMEDKVGSRPGTIRDAIRISTEKTKDGVEHNIFYDWNKLGKSRFLITGTRKMRPNDILTNIFNRYGAKEE
jgi:hypothetical protein